MSRPIRVLIAKIGLDGHDRGAKVISLSLRRAGMEVIYSGLRHTSAEIVNTAIQEDVDVIGVSILSGAHNTVFKEILDLLEKDNINDILLIGGGIIPLEDISFLLSIGVKKIFTPGTDTNEIIQFIQNNVNL